MDRNITLSKFEKSILMSMATYYSRCSSERIKKGIARKKRIRKEQNY